MNRWTLVASLGLGVTLGFGARPVVAQSPKDSGAAKDTAGAMEVAQASVAATGPLGDALPAYTSPSCMSGLSQPKVKRAAATLQTALDSKVPAERATGLHDAEQALVDVLTKDKQEKNAAAWFSLGQAYLYQGNVVGADTVLRRAAKLAPGCRADIDDFRYAAWAPLMNGGIELLKAKNADSAIVRFRNAARILPDKPQAALNAGVLFANAGNHDSAIVYFGQAAELADRAKMAEERNRATYNMAAMLQQAGRHAEAVTALERYLTWVPDDKDAKGALATSYRAVGQTDKAQAIDQELFAAVGPSDTGAAAKSESPKTNAATAATAMKLGVNFYNDKKFTDAAAAFQKVLEIEPNNRDAIYNLANTYYSLNDHAKLVEVGERLIRIEPMNENALQLLGAGYKNTNNIDKAIKIAEQVLAMPLDVVAKEFITHADEVKLTMSATGRAAQTPAGKPISPAPVTLTFEFLDETGAVVATQEAGVPAMKPDEAQDVVVNAKAKGIVAWRYAIKK